MLPGASLSVLAALPAALQDPAAGGYGGPDLTWYLASCALIVGGIGVVGWLLRRLLGRAIRMRAARRSLEIVDLLPLGGRQRLVVVRCYDRSFLVGLGEKEVHPIAELAAEDAPAPDLAGAEEEKGTIRSPRDPSLFAALLRQGARAPRGGPIGAEPRSSALRRGRGILG
ncbi:MAG: flagellar biosynthetic protein FliO [Planctomycetota bacterium]